MEYYGGNPNCITSIPEIFTFPVLVETEYILLGSDGIFDHLNNDQIH